MSTAVPPIPPTDPATTSLSSAPPTGAPASPSASDFKFGEDAPAWAQGKSAKEILGIASQLNDTLGQYIRTGNPSPAPAPAPTYTPPAQQNYVPDEEYVTGAAFRREAQQYVTATQEQLNALTEMSAQNALAQVQREFGKEFQRFGPTINANLAALRDKKAWTVDNLRRVVKYSLADHVEEIAGDIAARRLAEMEPTLRSNGAAPVQVTQQEQKFTLQSDALPEHWKKQAQEAGLTEQAVDEFCRATNTTREAFFGMIGKTAITEAPRR